ncbi:MAG: hypothetical protein EPN30_01560 [Actinomycetota bacterium]|nr:MAG: hypothetical protein EPN30_01560 [Actinomycetota bacterium]
MTENRSGVKWHGRPTSEIGTPGVPPQEVPFVAEASPEGPFGTVRFVGRYGLFCANPSELERNNISYGDAKEIAWDAFGLCGGNVSFYDMEGNYLFERNAPLP